MVAPAGNSSARGRFEPRRRADGAACTLASCGRRAAETIVVLLDVCVEFDPLDRCLHRLQGSCSAESQRRNCIRSSRCSIVVIIRFGLFLHHVWGVDDIVYVYEVHRVPGHSAQRHGSSHAKKHMQNMPECQTQRKCKEKEVTWCIRKEEFA